MGSQKVRRLRARAAAENPTQVAGSYGGVAFMILAVLYILVTVALLGLAARIYLRAHFYQIPLSSGGQAWMLGLLALALATSLLTFWLPMRRGIRALEELG